MAKKVYLSPSNQMHNACQWGDVEGEHCQELARLIADRLLAHGIEVMIRNPGNGISANIREAKSFGADLYIPLHTNAVSDKPHVRGTRFGYHETRLDSKAACEVFAKRWKQFYPLPSKVKTCTYTFSEAKKPHCPSVYTELVFHSSPEDAAFLHENMVPCAITLVNCILDYFAMEAPPQTPAEMPQVDPQGIPATLHIGSKGGTVERLQTRLNAWNDTRDYAAFEPLNVDGIFGPLTEDAVIAFQKVQLAINAAFKIDGIAGPQTWGALLYPDETEEPAEIRLWIVQGLTTEQKDSVIAKYPGATAVQQD